MPQNGLPLRQTHGHAALCPCGDCSSAFDLGSSFAKTFALSGLRIVATSGAVRPSPHIATMPAQTNGKAEVKAQAHTPASLATSIPASILEDAEINAAIAAILPAAYQFEIHKTIHHIRTHRCSSVALQMPEGLTLWATGIADILERFTGAQMTIMGDVTYGACCVDDYTALALGCDLLVHYGHSCLVPVDQTKIKTLYVFVEIKVDAEHVAETIRANFPSEKAGFRRKILGAGAAEKGKARLQIEQEETGGRLENGEKGCSESTHLVLVGTVQFINAIQGLRDNLEEPFDPSTSSQGQERLLITSGTATDAQPVASSSATPFSTGTYRITVPQVKPLSPGEVLGCTSPKLNDPSIDAILYLGDGRFHLESIMIANPRVPAFRYDPYTKRFMRELYDHAQMRRMRGDAVRTARASISAEGQDSASSPDISAAAQSAQDGEEGRGAWGLILGTLGRQGSLSVLQHLRSTLSPRIPSVPILLSELSPQKLSLFGEHLSAFIQTSCPRLSIDWGSAFPKPLLSPYEAAVALKKTHGWDERVDGLGMTRKPAPEAREKDMEGDYPMDFYANDSRGPWTPRHGHNAPRPRAAGSNLAILKKTKAKMLAARQQQQQQQEAAA